MKTHKIYAIVDPRDELPFYVGVSQNIDTRFAQHLHDKINPEKQRRIQSIQNEGMEPRIDIIEEWEERGLAETRERFWILTYIEWSIPLTNMKYTEYFNPDVRVTPVPSVHSVPHVSQHVQSPVKTPFISFIPLIESYPRPSWTPARMRVRKGDMWIQNDEIDHAWIAFSEGKSSPYEATEIEFNAFLSSCSIPRIPVLREGDKYLLHKWRQLNQWMGEHPVCYIPSF